MHGWVGEPQSEDSGMGDGSTRTRTSVSNVLVIGSGAAGLRAAIAAHEAGSEVVVIGARPRKDAHTVLAAGGINAALGTRDPEDSWQQHFADTLKEGYNLSDPRVVEIMAKEAPAPSASSPSGAPRSRGRLPGSSISASSGRTSIAAPATRATILAGRCSSRSWIRRSP